MAKTEKPQNFEALSAVDVADLLGVTEKSIRNWMNKKGLPFLDGPRGRTLHWPSVLEWYVTYRIAEDGNGGNRQVSSDPAAPEMPPETYEQALARLTRAKADLEELKRAREQGLVVAIEDVQGSVSAVAIALKQQILGFPAKLAPRLYGLKDKGRVRAILDQEARDLCIKLASIGEDSAPAPAPAEGGDEPDSD